MRDGERLGDADTYAGSSLRVPQRVTAWSDTSVTYTVAKGALPTGPVWEFVVDDDDVVVQTRPRTMN